MFFYFIFDTCSFLAGFSVWESGRIKKAKSESSWDETRRKSAAGVWLVTLLSFLSVPARTSWRCSRHLIPLNPQLFHHCHSLLCGSDNGSNYGGSIFAPHPSYSMGEMWPHPAATSTAPPSPSAQPAHAQTSWNEIVFVKYLIESFSIFFFLSCSFHPLFTRQVFYQAWMHYAVSVGFTGI